MSRGGALSGEEGGEGPTARKRRRFRRVSDGFDVAEGGCCLVEAVAVLTLLATPMWLFLT